MNELPPKVLKNIDRLRRAASETTRYLIDRVSEAVIPIPLRNGFSVAPEYLRNAKNEFGQIWGINEIPFQDRSVSSWPTILVQLDRDLSPNFRIDLCTIPHHPIMLGGPALPRHEANCAHSVRLLRLRKGRSGSYRDQHFGPGDWACFKQKKIDEAIATPAVLLARVASIKHCEAFLENVIEAVGSKHIYESWNEKTPDRPNQST